MVCELQRLARHWLSQLAMKIERWKAIPLLLKGVSSLRLKEGNYGCLPRMMEKSSYGEAEAGSAQMRLP
ncbi:hypothetical protein QQ045_007631 [Rhodiola kirilowii]